MDKNNQIFRIVESSDPSIQSLCLVFYDDKHAFAWTIEDVKNLRPTPVPDKLNTVREMVQPKRINPAFRLVLDKSSIIYEFRMKAGTLSTVEGVLRCIDGSMTDGAQDKYIESKVIGTYELGVTGYDNEALFDYITLRDTTHDGGQRLDTWFIPLTQQNVVKERPKAETKVSKAEEILPPDEDAPPPPAENQTAEVAKQPKRAKNNKKKELVRRSAVLPSALDVNGELISHQPQAESQSSAETAAPTPAKIPESRQRVADNYRSRKATNTEKPKTTGQAKKSSRGTEKKK